MIISQMKCENDFCADLSSGCAPLANNTLQIDENDAAMSNAFAQFYPYEDTGYCPDGYYAKKLYCLEWECSVIALECVKVFYIQ